MNKNKIKMLALDLDGTTLTSGNELTREVELAIKRAIESGIEVVAASGRSFASMPQSVMSIESLRFAVTSNGSAVYDKNGKRIHSSLLDEKEVLRLLSLTEPYDLIFEAFIDGLTYTDSRYVKDPEKYGCSKAYVDYVRASHGHINDMRSFIYEHRTELDSVEYVCTNKSLREKIRAEIANGDENLFITSSSENFVEFTNAQATKWNAVKWLANYLGISREEICACGNADNDADMIKYAGLGAAVKNASRLCLDNADIVVKTNDSGGVVELVDYILSCCC